MNKLLITVALAAFAITGVHAQGGAVYMLIANDGKDERLKEATKILNERVAAVQAARAASAASAASAAKKKEVASK